MDSVPVPLFKVPIFEVHILFRLPYFESQILFRLPVFEREVASKYLGKFDFLRQNLTFQIFHLSSSDKWPKLDTICINKNVKLTVPLTRFVKSIPQYYL